MRRVAYSVIALWLMGTAPAIAQTTTTDCYRYGGGSMSCTSRTQSPIYHGAPTEGFTQGWMQGQRMWDSFAAGQAARAAQAAQRAEQQRAATASNQDRFISLLAAGACEEAKALAYQELGYQAQMLANRCTPH